MSKISGSGKQVGHRLGNKFGILRRESQKQNGARREAKRNQDGVRCETKMAYAAKIYIIWCVEDYAADAAMAYAAKP